MQTPGDAPAMDASADAFAPFSPPTPITELNDATADDQYPAMTEDLLEFYFVSRRPLPTDPGDAVPRNNVWTARRVATSDRWSAPTPVTALNTGENPTHLALSSDGLQLYFTKLPAGAAAGNFDVYVSVRASRASDWPPATAVAELNSPASESGLSISHDGLTFALDSNRGGASGRDLYLATRAKLGDPWSIPQGIASLNTAADDENPRLVRNGLVIWYESTIDFSQRIAVRPDLNSPFGSAVQETEVAWTTADVQAWVSDDQSVVVFARPVAGASGPQADLFIAKRGL